MTPERLKSVYERMLLKTFWWPDGCLIFEGNTGNAAGHKRISLSEGGKPKNYWAHRLAFAYYHNLDPDEMDPLIKICHSCDFSPCIAKDHLVAATQKKNIEEIWERGRMPLHCLENLKNFRERRR